MRFTALLLIIGLMSACGGGPSKKSDPEPEPVSATDLDAKKDELARIEQDLYDIRREREKWEATGPSEEKVKRLADLKSQEDQLNVRRDQLNLEIARAEGGPEPASADDALDMMEEAVKDQEEDLEKKIAKAADDEKRREIEEAARAREEERRKMEEERRRLEAESKNLLDKGPIFEETYADVISRIRSELQKYKRW